MLSMVAIAALATGFTGCSSDTNNTTSGQSDVIKTPKGTVTGTVMDTNGNPLAGVKVYAAGMETETDEGGVYVFEDVAVVNTANAAGATTRNNSIQVTIAAPEGYLGATVLVTPEAQQISSGDNGTSLAETNPNTNFVDGYIANAGTAILPELSGTVHGVMRNNATGEAVANEEVCLDLTANAFSDNNTAFAANISYATTKYCDQTDASGVFDIEHAPVDATLQFAMADWNVLNPAAVTVEDTVVTNIGTLTVSPIVSVDNIAPQVVGVKEGLMPSTTGRMMLVDDARTSFTLVFSETLAVDSDGSDLPDQDMTSSVSVYVGTTPTNMTKVNATATYDGNQLTIELPAPLNDNELVNVHLLNSDFRDLAGNFLTVDQPAVVPNIGYDAAEANGVTTAVYLQAFNDLNLEAPAPTDVAQQKTDENGQDDYPLLTQASNAFNDVMDGVVGIQQMNSTDDDQGDGIIDSAQRLGALASAIQGTAVAVAGNVPRVTFTPNGAGSYIIALTRNGVAVDLTPAGVAAVQFQGTPGTVAENPNDNTQVVFTPTDATDVTPLEFVINATALAQVGDLLTITPVDDLGYPGTPVALTLEDNVNPTTVLQYSYNAGQFVNGSNTVVRYGAGGELAQDTGAVTPGLPYFVVTPGLLDNLNGTTAINGTTIQPDLSLSGELYAYNTLFDDDDDTATPDVKLAGVYDSNAFVAMPKGRTVGVAFSEDITLKGTPKTTGITSELSGWAASNDITVNGRNNIPVNIDLVDMQVSDVFTFANDDNGGVIDYTGVIADNAGNVADEDTKAKVVLLDKMPPMVTKAFFDGTNMIITFNEKVKIAQGMDVTVIDETGAGKTSYYSASTWTLSDDKLTLTIDAATFGDGLEKDDFALGKYAEAAYGSDKHEHAAMRWSVQDVRGNDWINNSVGVAQPDFASVEIIGDFSATTDNTKFVAAAKDSNTDEKIVWTFNQKIVTGTDELFNACGTTLNADDDADDINEWFEYVDSSDTAHALTDYMDDVKISLDSDCKVITMTFVAGGDTNNNAVEANDVVRNVGTKVFTSDVDNSQTESVSASAND